MALNLLRQTATLTRASAGIYDTDGVWVPGSTTEQTIRCSIQPISGSDLYKMPEGDRSKASAVIYSSVELKIMNETNKTPSDQITDSNGNVWTVMKLEDWGQGQGINTSYYKAVLSKVEA